MGNHVYIQAGEVARDQWCQDVHGNFVEVVNPDGSRFLKKCLLNSVYLNVTMFSCVR